MSAEGEAFHARMAGLKALVLDVDGVLTDGALWLGLEGEEIKRFHVQDGLGVQRARAAGLRVGWVSGRRCEAVERRARELGVADVRQAVASKVAGFEELCRVWGVRPGEAAYMGDDVTDLPALRAAGIALAPADAAEEVRACAHHVTPRAGGHGAVRDAIEWLLRHRGVA